jgi:hypothetical protein
MTNDLTKIIWKGISIFPEKEGYQLVLLCETEEQANQLLRIMSNSKFSFKHGDSQANTKLLIIEFPELLSKVSLSLPPDQSIFRHFEGGLINRITTGVDLGDKGIACNDVEIEIRDQSFGRQN